MTNMKSDAGERLLSISEFSKISRTSKDTLIHYDKIGALKPFCRNDTTGYRYYAAKQVATINLIRTLKRAGLSLDEIKNYTAVRSPEELLKILDKQIKKADAQIVEWGHIKKLLSTIYDISESVLQYDTKTITVQFVPAQPIILGDLNDYSQGQSNYDALLEFYRKCAKTCSSIDLDYPVWGIISEDRIGDCKWTPPERFYLFHPEGCDRKPAGLYAIGHTCGDYMDAFKLFERMKHYISENNFEICGDAYEEYPINELSTTSGNYLIRVMIPVKAK